MSQLQTLISINPTNAYSTGVSFLGSQFLNVAVNGSTYGTYFWNAFLASGARNDLGINPAANTSDAVTVNSAGTLTGCSIYTTISDSAGISTANWSNACFSPGSQQSTLILPSGVVLGTITSSVPNPNAPELLQVSASNLDFSLPGNSAASLTGINDKVVEAAFATLTLSSGSINGTAYGTGDALALSNGDVLNNNSGAAVGYFPSVNVSLGANGTYSLGGTTGNAVTLATGDTVNASNDLFFFTGGINTISGLSNTIVDTGSGTLSASGSTIQENFGSTAYSNLNVTLLGINDKMTLASSDALTLGAGSSSGTVDGTGMALTLSNGDILTNNTGAAAYYIPLVNATLAANGSYTVGGSTGSAITLASNDTLAASNDFAFFNGGADALIGSNDTVVVSGGGTLTASNSSFQDNFGSSVATGLNFAVIGSRNHILLSTSDSVTATGSGVTVGFSGSATGASAVVNDTTTGTSSITSYVGNTGAVGTQTSETFYSQFNRQGSITGSSVTLNDGTRQTVLENSSGKVTLVTTNYADGTYSTVTFGTSGTLSETTPTSTTNNYSSNGQLVESTYAYTQFDGPLYNINHIVTFYNVNNSHTWSNIQYLYGNSEDGPGNNDFTGAAIHNHDGTQMLVNEVNNDPRYYQATFKSAVATWEITSGSIVNVAGNLYAAGDNAVVNGDVPTMAFLGGFSGPAPFNPSTIAVNSSQIATDYSTSFLQTQNAISIQEINQLSSLQSALQNFNQADIIVSVNPQTGVGTVIYNSDPGELVDTPPITVDPLAFVDIPGAFSPSAGVSSLSGQLPAESNGHWGY